MKKSSSMISILFGSVIFLGALLLFLIQPIITKQLLPWFGGSPAVWSMGQLFFTIMLLVGYFYCHYVTKLSMRHQIIIHSVLVVASVTMIYSQITFFDPIGSANEALLKNPPIGILEALFTSIGLLYFLLATTSPLLQFWFSEFGFDKTPYRLYAVSNAGSLAALAAYPFFMEPLFSLHHHLFTWIAMYLGYAIGMFVCIRQVSKHPSFAASSRQQTLFYNPSSTIPISLFTRWMFFSMLPVLLLLAMTNHLTQGIAPTPLLWLVPLALYLCSFIFTFRKKPLRFPEIYSWGFLLITICMLPVFMGAGDAYLWLQILGFLLLLFFSCMVCHTKLYALKPDPSHLNIFYLFVATGGALGSVFVTIIAPFIFSGFFELPLGIILMASIVGAVLWPTFTEFSKMQRASMLISCIVFVTIFGVNYFTSEENVIVRLRNFYGVVRVSASKLLQQKGSILRITHGSIVHGSQFQGCGQSCMYPTTYYATTTGIGAIITHVQKQHERRMRHELRIGVIGLGAGTLAAYCRPTDYMRFYEINPQVINIAKTYFSYLKDCHGTIDIVEDDARRALEKELKDGHPQRFDVFVVDAFTDDAIPTHLITKEAMLLYLRHLREHEGILAIHVSNKYIDLLPVIKGHLDHFGLHGVIIKTTPDYTREIFPAHWVLLSYKPIAKEFFSKRWVWLSYNPTSIDPINIPNAAIFDLQNIKKSITWTDQYSSIIHVLK